MTAVSHPATSPRSGRNTHPSPQRPPSRPRVRPAPARLVRPAPARRWDPLCVDVEGQVATEYDLPPLRELPPPEPEDLSKVASILAKAVVEVLQGTRSIQQIQAWLLDDVWQAVRRRAALTQRSSGQRIPPSAVRVIRVHPCPINERTCELSVVLHDGRRVRAAALRLTLHRGRWRAAAIRIG